MGIKGPIDAFRRSYLTSERQGSVDIEQAELLEGPVGEGRRNHFEGKIGEDGSFYVGDTLRTRQDTSTRRISA